jgi:hypothetical protein
VASTEVAVDTEEEEYVVVASTEAAVDRRRVCSGGVNRSSSRYRRRVCSGGIYRSSSRQKKKSMVWWHQQEQQ